MADRSPTQGRAPRIVLYGHFGTGNIGNDSTLEAAVRGFRQCAPAARLIVVCPGPAEVAARFGVETLPIDASELHRGAPRARALRLAARAADEARFWSARTWWLRGVDLFAVVGTGAVDDMAVRPWNAPYDLFKWCHAARLAGCRVAFMSVGAGPIAHPLSRRLMVRALRAAHFRSYRDQESAAFARSCGLDVPSDAIAPDLVFGLPHAGWPAAVPPAHPPRVVGLGVIGYYGWRHDEAAGAHVFETYLRTLSRFLHWLLDRGYTVRLLTGDLPTDQRPVDALLAGVREAGTPAWTSRVIASRHDTVDELRDEIMRTDVVVASRFHNVLTALLCGRPAVSLGYHAKNEALMAAFGLGDLCQHIEQLDADRLIAQFEALVARADAARAVIASRTAEYRAQLDAQYRHVVSLTGAAAPARSAVETGPLAAGGRR